MKLNQMTYSLWFEDYSSEQKIGDIAGYFIGSSINIVVVELESTNLAH